MHLLSNTIGQKAVVAATGALLLFFVLAHLFGTLSAFSGPDAINTYAQTLRHFGFLFLVYRVAMTLVLILHVTFAVLVTATNWRAKPNRYAVKKLRAASFAGETMIWSGLLLLAFLVYHVLQFTLHATSDVIAQADAQGRFDVFTMMRESLRHILVSTVYTLAIAALFLHLSHGIQSVPQTIGLLNEKSKPGFHILGTALSTILLLGYGAIPLLVLAGVGVFGK